MTRARVIHLRNDYKLVMSWLEQAVHAQFAAQPSSQAQESAAPSSSRQAESSQADTPFAKVNSVAPNSPAAEAGLLPGDQITRFGIATWLNHERLAKVSQIVGQSQGVSCASCMFLVVANASLQRAISVTILRGSANLNLTLTPRSDWGGRGSLGCHLVPL
jgi:26S proteasome regulatory subunit N4